VKSLIGLSPTQEATVKALGLRHIRQTVEHDDSPTVRGMIRQVPFCVKVEERAAAEGEASGSAAGRAAAVAGRAGAEGEASDPVRGSAKRAEASDPVKPGSNVK
jgi:large subunit ribosomal protein L30